MSRKLDRILNFQIDDYLNDYVPYPRYSRLPAPIARFLGFRIETFEEPPHLIICLWSFVGALAGLLTIGALYQYAPGLARYNPPVIIASLGASAILDYNCIRTPLAQPRNAFFGQTFSALIGVAIAKLFQLRSDFEALRWVAGAVCCACASLAMALTNTTHPPGGATAVLAATNTQIIAMGWIYVPFVMLGSVVMLTVALLVNNVQRQYPVYWWTAVDLRARARARDKLALEKTVSRDSEQVLRGQSVARHSHGDPEAIVIAADHMFLPDAFDLDPDEVAVLARLQARLRWDRAMDERPASLDGRTVAE
ncbi:hypothetical protein MBLNU459_g5307t1 [Dothideomycetes sp. NU459]